MSDYPMGSIELGVTSVRYIRLFLTFEFVTDDFHLVSCVDAATLVTRPLGLPVPILKVFWWHVRHKR